MGFHWSLSDSNSPLISRTLLSILANLINAIVSMVYTRLLYYYYYWRVFHTSSNWWVSTGVWVTVTLLWSPGLFLVFWPISSMLLFRWSTLVFFIIIIIGEFFTPALTDVLSLEFEWQQVSSSLQESSQYSGDSQQCWNLDGLNSPSYFQLLQFLYQSFGNCTKSTNFNWYHRHFYVPHVYY